MRQVKVRLGGYCSLAAVEVQLRSGPLFLFAHGWAGGAQYQVHRPHETGGSAMSSARAACGAQKIPQSSFSVGAVCAQPCAPPAFLPGCARVLLEGQVPAASTEWPTGCFFTPVFQDIVRPPNVVLSSYIRGSFAHRPFLVEGSSIPGPQPAHRSNSPINRGENRRFNQPNHARSG